MGGGQAINYISSRSLKVSYRSSVDLFAICSNMKDESVHRAGLGSIVLVTIRDQARAWEGSDVHRIPLSRRLDFTS